jgi:hypothetical protein
MITGFNVYFILNHKDRKVYSLKGTICLADKCQVVVKMIFLLKKKHKYYHKY